MSDATPKADTRQLAPVSVTRFPTGGRDDDRVIVEEPLEIRVDGEPLAVLMRTPGDDLALTAGFLHSEGVIASRDDLVSLRPCVDPNRGDTRYNIVQVRLATGVAAENVERARRRTAMTASCGVCGKTSIDSVMLDTPALPQARPLRVWEVAALGPAAVQTQALFSETGGLHGAVLFQRRLQGMPDVAARAEDVGRHNAVDKVVGRLLRQGQMAGPDSVLWLSGRAGFEVVQKALMASIPALVAVGAPTSLAVSLAQRAGMTLVGFARRDDVFNVYAGDVEP